MNSCLSPSEAADRIRRLLRGCGACACGIARADSVPATVAARYYSWLDAGMNAGMDYMERHRDIRLDPRLLHESTRSIIAAAFNYRPAEPSQLIADYALGTDYHYVLKERLGRVAAAIEATLGGSCRTVVDSAPMLERYWAVEAGVGFVADNGLLCVPGYGMAVVLGFILWTGDTRPDPAGGGECLHCGRCRRACPGGALGADGLIDGRRCLSYLTIEHRGQLPDDIPRLTHVYGCDNCRRACPLDQGPVTDIAEFAPHSGIAALTAADMARMTTGRFRQLFRCSPLMRVRLQGLRRNALAYIAQRET